MHASVAQNGAKGNIDRVQFKSERDVLNVNYMLSDKAGGFFDAILDELKAGKRIRIQHTADMYTTGLWAKHIGEAERSYYVSYDLLRNYYTFDEEDGNTYRTKDEDFVRAFLFTVKALPVIEAGRLTTGDEYVVKFVSKYREDDRDEPWYKKVSLGWLKEVVTDEVVYIAR